MLKVYLLILALLTFSPARAASPVVTLTSPAAFQVFQRDTTTNTASLVISGQIANWTGDEYTVSAWWRGVDSGVLWQGSSASFSAVWSSQSVGQGDLLVTVAGMQISVPVVGVGDVYVIAGQSNAVGWGAHPQMYMDSLGLRAGMLTFHGWGELEDPTGYVYDHQAKGSAWPLLASYILDSGVPVAFIPVALSGTLIQSWQPGSNLYHNMTRLIDKLPTPYARAILWQQGEGNAHTPSKDYSVYLSTIADALYTRYGTPLLAAYLYNKSLVDAGIDEAIRGDAHVLAGADLRVALPPSASVHYHTDAELQSEAWAWFQALVADGFYTGAPYLP